MFETKKIDTFFSGEKNLLDEEEKSFISRRTKVVRFFKLFLPCLTALLLGLGVILFDFDSTLDSVLPLAEEEKIYFEKFRMKNTVFEITEKDNKLSILKASIVEELETNSKIYNLTNPDAQTTEKDKLLSIRADKGVYDQNKQVLDLDTNVVADYNGEMLIKTSSATYNFLTESGFGNEKVVGDGERGHFEADQFKFDKKNGVIDLLKNVYLKGKNLELRSPDRAILYSYEDKFLSPNAVLHKGKDIIQGDVLTVFFKDTKDFEIDVAFSEGHTAILSNGTKAYADRGEYDAATDTVKLFKKVTVIDDSGYTANGDEGIFDNMNKIFTLKKNVVVRDKSGYKATAKIGIYDLNKQTFTLDDGVKITKGTNVITAPKAIYFRDKDEFRFYDDVKVVQDDGTATAKSGVYFIKKNYAELENNVVITKKGNKVYGDKAISDFETSKSRIIGTQGRRIFGKLFESTFKKKKGK